MADPLVVHNRYRNAQTEALGNPTDGLTATVAASQAVTGGTLVAFDTGADRTVRVAGAGSLRVMGVAGHDVGASDGERKLTVYRDGVWRLTATGAIQAGDRLEAAASGNVRVLTAIDVTGSLDPRAIIGYALEDIANGATGKVALNLT